MATKKKTNESTGAVGVAVLTDVLALVQSNREHTLGLIAAYRAALSHSRKTFPKATQMTKEERKTSSGRVSKVELPILVKILDVIDAHAEVFSSLAAKDHGKDPKKVETDVARHAIELLEELVPLVEELQEAARQASDLALRLGEIVRNLTTPGYAIGNANASVNEALRSDIAIVNDAYRKRSQANKSEKKPKKAAPTG